MGEFSGLKYQTTTHFQTAAGAKDKKQVIMEIHPEHPDTLTTNKQHFRLLNLQAANLYFYVFLSFNFSIA